MDYNEYIYRGSYSLDDLIKRAGVWDTVLNVGKEVGKEVGQKAIEKGIEWAKGKGKDMLIKALKDSLRARVGNRIEDFIGMTLEEAQQNPDACIDAVTDKLIESLQERAPRLYAMIIKGTIGPTVLNIIKDIAKSVANDLMDDGILNEDVEATVDEGITQISDEELEEVPEEEDVTSGIDLENPYGETPSSPAQLTY